MTQRKPERGICELYEQDPERADWLIFGREACSDRRGFLRGAGLATMAGVVGATIPFHRNMPSGLIPAALAEETQEFTIEGKDGLTVLNDRPVNAETPAHLLNDDVTPTARHFIRNNGIPPQNTAAEGWTLKIDGLVNNTMEMTIDELKDRFEVVRLALQLECGGNGRAAFNPPASGNQWTVGAVANSEWTGVRLRDVLMAAGVQPDAVYTAHYGADSHLSGDPEKDAVSRGMPIWKAMDPDTIIAFEQNGAPIHPMNGAPLRLVAPGWPGSTSQKWLTRIWIRDQVHDGQKMGPRSYRVPRYPVAPGEEVPDEDFQIIESMPVKSLITSPKSGHVLPVDHRTLEVRGHAWAGDELVTAVDLSTDFGATWQPAELMPPMNGHSWQTWRAQLNFPTRGYYEIWARATDSKGRMQPFTVNWNPKGYLNNSMHRIAVRVEV
ncbi:sulfite oxidase [Dichotomicrobium thermohalophilum]|uniref:Sulfite dehydrogenase (Cytochrome) subunit SorA apoprotein n=1 Tax=Dichotomicrobium thermohalophilum TaxID=933063 RepID=A0A397QAT0_9HYPH|nr:sulfite oxidase [Dichotomicrobium thermohalophilum]RIA55224.1 sulfite dehydrogenase (cytochrome) subunit SorA apoprotein [Dichotomicrobium thermohalophilum]